MNPVLAMFLKKPIDFIIQIGDRILEVSTLLTSPGRLNFPRDLVSMKERPHSSEAPPQSANDGLPPISEDGQRFDVFISYRRDGGAEVARFTAEKLRSRGYRVFLDVESLNSGEWGGALLRRIEECTDFVVVVTDKFFDRCENPDDVVRCEISHALKSSKFVIPLLVERAQFPSHLPTDIAHIAAHNGVRYFHDYAEQSIEKLCRFLHSARAFGPSRLASGETKARVVVFCFLFTIGIWQGARLGEQIEFFSRIRYGWLTFAVPEVLICLMTVLFLIAIGTIALSWFARKKGVQSEAFFAGPWAPFFATVGSLMTVSTWFFVLIVQGLLSVPSFFLGGILGGALAVLLTRVLISKNLWALLTRSLK